MKNLIILLVLLVISGCAEGVQVQEDNKGNTFALYGNWTDAEIALFQTDMNAWSKDKKTVIEMGDEGESIIELVDYETIQVKCNSKTNYACINADKVNGKVYSHIYVRDVRGIEDYENTLRRVVLHELGHHIGYCGSHLPAGNIMAAKLDLEGPEELTAADLDYRFHCPK